MRCLSPSRPIIRSAIGLCVSILFHATIVADVPEPELSPITTAAEVRNLTADEAREGRPVRLRGVVTCSDQVDFHAVFLQDATGGIYVEKAGDPTLRQGQLLEVEGRSGSGSFAPIVVAQSWRILGEAPLPEPLPANAASLAGGQMDSQWLQVEGVVRSVTPNRLGRYVLEIGLERESLRVLLSDFPVSGIELLVDSRVRAQGVCFTKRNFSGQWLANYLAVSGPAHLMQVEPGPPPETVPVSPIAQLFRFPPLGLDGHRIKVRGTALCAPTGGSIFLQDGAHALQVQAAGFGLIPGDEVEALGFPHAGGFYPVLEEARIRVFGHRAPPTAARAGIADLVAGRYGGQLVRLQARLVDLARSPDGALFILQSTGQLFAARIFRDPASPEDTVPPVGSLLDLTGVCVLPSFSHWDHASPIRADSFELLLRSVADIVVLQKPPWWTVGRVASLLALVTAILGAALVWVALLRRQVLAQTRLIENKIQREARLEERARIARDLHDTLAQGFAGIAFQLEAVVTHLGDGAQQIHRHLDLALTMVRHSLGEARRSVMNLRSQALETRDLGGALAETTRTLLGATGVDFELETEGVVRSLPLLVENNLLRIGQEAVTNAIKYSRAQSIGIHLNYCRDSVVLRVKDSGQGFDPAALPQGDGMHFGLRGIRERAREMNGTVQIESHPGRGAAITVTVPISAAKPNA